MVNYTVIVEDSVLGGIVEEVEVSPDNCVDAICSIAFDGLVLNQTYCITVMATNILGSSMPAVILCKLDCYS